MGSGRDRSRAAVSETMFTLERMSVGFGGSRTTCARNRQEKVDARFLSFPVFLFFPDPYVKFGALAFWGDEFFIEACAMLRIHFSFPIYPRFILTQPGVTYTRKLGFSR